MPFRPLFSRDEENDLLDSLHEGVPSWMRPTLFGWIAEFTGSGRYVADDFVNGFEIDARVQPPLERGSRFAPRDDLFVRMQRDADFALTLVDYALYALKNSRDPWASLQPLIELLERSGSVWAVSEREGGEGHWGWRLVRRELVGAKAAVEDLREQPGRAGDFLTASWNAVAGRDPSPSDGYDKAVKAVEAAAHAIVTPQDADATLGKMLAAMRDKPEKWVFSPPVEADMVLSMAKQLWRGHMRHGTDARFGEDDTARTDHSVNEARAALLLSIALVGFFQGGQITRSVSV